MFWDDYDTILNNRFIKEWSFWPQLVSQNIIAGAYQVGNHWRPLLSTVFAIEWHLWNNWTPGWHAVSILTHIAASVPLFLLIKTLFNSHWLALLTALIFLVHPAQTEAIVSPNAMGDALAGLFVFWGLLFFTRARFKKQIWQERNYWLALTCYPLAILSKETGALLVAFIALIIINDRFLVLRATQETPKTPLLSLLPFGLLAVGYIFLRATILNFLNSFNYFNETTAFTTHIGIRILVFFQALASYAGILFFPYDLRAVRINFPPEILFTPNTAQGLAFFSSLVFLAWYFRRKQPAITFGILWFFVAILAQSNLIVIINAITHEHFLYTALIGIWLAVFALLLGWARNEKRQKILTVGFLILFVTFCIRVIWRNTDWHTAIGFYEKELITSPNNYSLLNNLATEYTQKGLHEKALAIYTQTISLNPMNPEAYHNLANLEKDTGQTEHAITHYEKAIAVQPKYLLPYNSLAWLYLNKKEYAKARRVLEQQMSVSTEIIPTLRALIGIALQEGAYNDAKRYLTILLKKQPGNEEATAWLNKMNSATPGSLKAVLIPSP